MDIGWGDQEKHWQAQAATKQGMHAIAAQERAWMMRGSMSNGSIEVSPAPGQDGCAIDDQITSADEAATDGCSYGQHEQHLG